MLREPLTCVLNSNQTSNVSSRREKTKTLCSPDKLSSVGKDVCESRTKDHCVLSFAVLYYIISKVEEVQAVIVVSWRKKKTMEQGYKSFN